MTKYGPGFKMPKLSFKLILLTPMLCQSSYLSTASTVMFPADDSEWSLAGNAGVAGFIRHPVRGIYTEPVTNN